jgi:Ca2+-binding RTX toxin-like protein
MAMVSGCVHGYYLSPGREDPIDIFNERGDTLARIGTNLTPPGSIANDAISFDVTQVLGTDKKDFIHVAGDGLIPPGGYKDLADATNGNDDINGGGGNDIVYAGDGNDYLLGESGDDFIDGGSGNDGVFGGTGADVLRGGDGNDSMFGGAGSDDVDGGAGDDTIYIESSSELGGAEVLHGGDGFDTLDIYYYGADISGWTIAPDIEALYGNNSPLKMSAAQLGMFESIYAQSITLVDGGLADISDGQMSSQLKWDNITLNLSPEDTVLKLPEANITKSILSTEPTFIVNGSSGFDVIYGSNCFDRIFGGAGNDTLYGGDGNDRLYGGFTTGIDKLYGGAGDDLLAFPSLSGFSSDSFDGGNGTDVLQTYEPFDFTGIDLSGIEILECNDITVSAAQLLSLDQIIGSDIRLTTGGLVDLTQKLTWGANYYLSNESTQLILATGDNFGNFSVIGGTGDDIVSGGYYSTYIFAGDGNDHLTSAVLGSELNGGNGNDTLVAGNNVDFLFGGAGDDLMLAGRDDDTYDGGTGTDTIDYSISTEAVVVDLGTGKGKGIGSHTYTAIENATGSSAGDKLTGSDSVNVLSGSEGDDILAGKGGDDTLSGGAGNDRMWGGLGADILCGGADEDTLFYNSVKESIGKSRDTIIGFDADADRIDLKMAVTGIDAAVTQGTLSADSFDGDMKKLLRPGDLAQQHAVLVTADTGDLAGQQFLVVDMNGKAGYQAGKDLVLHLDAAMHLESLDVTDFI